MAKLRVKHIGPIREGLPETINNGFIEFEGVTLFIGDQGSGKSTIAKLFSTFSWLEKARIRGEKERRSLGKILEYQNIHTYLNNRSEIAYRGVAYDIDYKDQKLVFTERKRLDYAFPKIMYTPAERNLGSSLKGASSIRGLPAPLYTFLYEYEAAKNTLNDNQYIDLPVTDTQFRHQSLNNTSFIRGKDYQINLLEASSGYQSMVPKLITARY